MAARSMRFGPVHMTCLVNSFESGDALLLIKLRALSEICHAVQILNLEEIAPTLSTGGNNLRRCNLGETPPVQRVPKTAQQCCLNAEDVADRFRAQGQRTEVQQSF